MKVVLILLCICTVGFSAEFELSNSQKIFIPDALKDEQLRAVLVIRNYGGMSGLYNKRPADWQAFMEQEKFAMLLFTPKNGVGKKDDVSSGIGKSDIARLDSALLEAEKVSGFKKLKGLPFIPFGISRGGANSLMMAAAASSKRAIAAVAHHGESGVGITLKKVPVLYTHAQFEPVKNKRNLKIDRWLQAIHGKSGVYYSTIMHKGYKHGSYGTGEFALQWVKEVVSRRLDKKGKIQKLSKDGSFFATYKIEGEETPSSKFINCAIQEKRSSKCKMWMPSKGVAELWLELMKKQEK